MFMGRSLKHRGNITDHFPQRRPCMNTLTWRITGGFAKVAARRFSA